MSETDEALDRLAAIDESFRKFEEVRNKLADLKAEAKDQAELVKRLTREHERVIREKLPLFDA